MNMQDAPVDTPRLRILDHVRRKSAISRIDPSEQIGISPTTVSVLCAELIESGLCRDAPGTAIVAPNRRGRPKTMVQLTPDATCIVPQCDNVSYTALPAKEELWDRYYTATPKRQRRCVERYKIVKSAWPRWPDYDLPVTGRQQAGAPL